MTLFVILPVLDVGLLMKPLLSSCLVSLVNQWHRSWASSVWQVIWYFFCDTLCSWKILARCIWLIGAKAANADTRLKTENGGDVYVFLFIADAFLWSNWIPKGKPTAILFTSCTSWAIHVLLGTCVLILSCWETVVETKQNRGPQSDQRFNLTRWDKLEKDFDFPLCFATRKADFFPPVLSLLEKAEIRPSPEKWAGVAIYKHVWLYYKPT